MSKLCTVIPATASCSRDWSDLLNLKQQLGIAFRLDLVTSATRSQCRNLKNYIWSDGLHVNYKFLFLLNDLICIIGKASVSVREGSFLGIPAVNIGTRQKDRAMVQNSENVAFRNKDIKHAIVKQVNHGRFESNKICGTGISGVTIVQLFSKLL